jgi:glutathione-specific gamma-glutamylcyclotransferase
MALTPDLVSRCFRMEPDPGSNPAFTPITDEERAELTERLVATHRGGPIWVFAYGSLIWNPTFVPAEVRRATARGWHRSFCLELTRWRGTPERPGLMMALERGGCCTGLLLRLPGENVREEVYRLVRREITVREDLGMARWVRVDSSNGPTLALVFWAGPKGAGIAHRLPLETVAWRLAHACGHAGSSADYLYRTVTKLEEHGIHDRNLWRLQELVAAEIASWDREVVQPAG